MVISEKIDGTSVVVIGEYTFNSNDFTTTIIIPESVTTIEDYAFYNCTSLTSITIGSGVGIHDEAFDTNFKTVYEAEGQAAGTYEYDGTTGTWVNQ